jgi:hypothetical protein
VPSEATELAAIHDELMKLVEGGRAETRESALTRLRDAANEVGEAWSRSWIGYHANVYYAGLKPPPPGDHFSSEWGLMTVGYESAETGWEEFRPEDVRAAIFKKAGDPDVRSFEEISDRAKRTVEEKRDEVLSILQAAASGKRHEDPFLVRLRDEVQKLKIFSGNDFINGQRPSGSVTSRDSTAMHQGLWVPPHLGVLAEGFALQQPLVACEQLARIANRASSHLSRLERQRTRESRIGTNVFIGHGRSSIWRDSRILSRTGWDCRGTSSIVSRQRVSRISAASRRCWMPPPSHSWL